MVVVVVVILQLYKDIFSSHPSPILSYAIFDFLLPPPSPLTFLFLHSPIVSHSIEITHYYYIVNRLQHHSQSNFIPTPTPPSFSPPYLSSNMIVFHLFNAIITIIHSHATHKYILNPIQNMFVSISKE